MGRGVGVRSKYPPRYSPRFYGAEEWKSSHAVNDFCMFVALLRGKGRGGGEGLFELIWARKGGICWGTEGNKCRAWENEI